MLILFSLKSVGEKEKEPTGAACHTILIKLHILGSYMALKDSIKVRSNHMNTFRENHKSPKNSILLGLILAVSQIPVIQF